MVRMYSFAYALLFVLKTVNAQDDVRLRDGVIVNKTKGEIFLTAPDQTLEVISEKSGKVIVKTEEKFKPLGLIKGRMIGQTIDSSYNNKFLLRSIDATYKRRFVKENSVELPKDVKVGFSQDDGGFQTSAITINGDIYVNWEYQPPVKGVFDSKEETATDEVKSGVIKIEKKSMKPFLLNELSVDLQRSIIPADSNLLSGIKGEQYFSADNKNILVSKKETNDTSFNCYTWTIYDLKKKKIGVVKDYRSFAPFYINGNAIIYEYGPFIQSSENSLIEIPLSITAVDLVSGQIIWNKQILDNINYQKSPPAYK